MNRKNKTFKFQIVLSFYLFLGLICFDGTTSLLAAQNFCKDLLISDFELRHVARILAQLELSFALDPQFNKDASFRQTQLNKFNLELKQFVLLAGDKALSLYNEEKSQANKSNISKTSSKQNKSKEDEVDELRNGVRTLVDQNDAISKVLVSSDSKFAVIQTETNLLRVIDFASGKLLYEMESSEVSMSPDNKNLIVMVLNPKNKPSPYIQIKVLALESGRELYELENVGTETVVTTDSQFLIISDWAGRFNIYDFTTGNLKYSSTSAEKLVGLHTKNNRVYIFDESDGFLRVFDLNSWQSIYKEQYNLKEEAQGFQLTPLKQKIMSAKISEDNRYLVTLVHATTKAFIKIIDLQAKKKVMDLEYEARELHKNNRNAFFELNSKNNQLLVVLNRNEVKSLELSTGKQSFAYSTEKDALIDQITFSGKYLITSEFFLNKRKIKNSVEVRDSQTGQGLYKLEYPHKRNQSLVQISISPDDRLLALGSPDGDIHILKTESGNEIFHENNVYGKVVNIFFTSDNSYLFVSSTDGQVKVIDLRSYLKK